MLLSIGYEGRSADEVVALCREYGVTVLVDVRLTPLSRKPGLSKTSLAQTCSAAEVRYLHLRDLGNPKDNREAFASDDTISLGRDRFRAVLDQPAARGALGMVGRLLETEHVALLCFERDHIRCHRSVVTETLEKLYASQTPCHI